MGFPAHAGMDPEPRRRLDHSIRFPRPRGDGPEQMTMVSAMVRVSPPTRGWTPPPPPPDPPPAGFPAHAGMDPLPAAQRNALQWFPRPRGDGPAHGVLLDLQALVSPPTRGWTTCRASAWRDSPGFPAHAGMDPERVMIGTVCIRFPRPRGDGPSEAQFAVVPDQVSPPTRGWTPLPELRRDPLRGFPAHAGMDPHGMSDPVDFIGFPRPRGDGPVDPLVMPSTCRASPPTRGWTANGRQHARPDGGFPAHAGMDP